MTFKVPIHLPDETPALDNTAIREEQIIIDESVSSVSDNAPCVSNSHIRAVIKKVAGILPAFFSYDDFCTNTLLRRRPYE